MYVLLLAVIYLAFISLGLPDPLLGAAWPTIRVDLAVPISYMGVITVIISLGTVLSGLLSERLTKRFGTKAVVIVSVLITAVAMLGFSFANNFWLLCLIGVPYGLGAGAIDAALNNYVALHYKSKHMSWLHCFWGVGTIISPYVMSYMLTRYTWSEGYRAVAYLQFAIALILIISIPLWKVNENKEGSAQGSEAPLLGIRGALKITGVPELLLGFFAYCVAETIAMAWPSSYMEIVFGVDKVEAAGYGSLFYMGMTVGRLVDGFIMDKFGDRKMIRYGSYLALVGAAMLFIPNKTCSIIGFVVFGLGCAPVYPCIVHSTPDNFGKDNSQAIIGIQMASAYMGGTLGPPLFGIIATYLDMRLMPVVLIAFMLLLLFMMGRTFKKCPQTLNEME